MFSDSFLFFGDHTSVEKSSGLEKIFNTRKIKRYIIIQN